MFGGIETDHLDHRHLEAAGLMYFLPLFASFNSILSQMCRRAGGGAAWQQSIILLFVWLGCQIFRVATWGLAPQPLGDRHQ